MLGMHLKILQEMGSHGVSCISMLPRRQLTAYSRYGTQQACPGPEVDEAGALDTLYDRCVKEGDSPVLIPYSDTWVNAVTKQMSRFKEVSTPCMPDREAAELVLDKERFCRLGQQRGYMTPMSWTLEEARELSDGQFPIVAKPKVHRMTGNRGMVQINRQMDRLRFVVIKDRQELERFVLRERDLLPYLTFQEYVRGMTDAIYNIGLYADRRSTVLGSVSGHKMRGYPASHGDCVLGENCELPEELMENALKIVRDLRLTGLAEFEYKKDSETGDFRLIEVNPRAWSWIGITPACGVSLPMMAYKDLTDAYDPSDFEPFSGKVKYVRLLEDLANCMYLYGKDHPPFKRSPSEWLRDIKADRLVVYDFDRRDPLPSAIIMVNMLQNMTRHALGRRGAQAERGRGTDRDPPPAM
jgi:predicted ATP-grasp superfamily ATP-dependent carboligase